MRAPLLILLGATLAAACGDNLVVGTACQADVECDDGNGCTADHCSLGICTHDAVVIDDGDACTTDACDAATGAITHAAVAVDDGNACTTDACEPASGVSHTAIAVDDGDACTTDACDPSTGVSHTAVVIDDGDACTTDSCDAATGVHHVAIATDDGDACTVDSCDATGVHHTAVVVDDGDPCTTDSCDTTTGVHHVAVATDDGDACTADTCDATGVHHTAIATDDSNACTIDTCDAATGVHHTAISIDDGDPCTSDTCDALTGVHHTAIAVDDGNACTVDSCDALGVHHVAIDPDDGDACTTDTCDAATGVHHVAVNTDDSDACTTDTCDATGIHHTAVAIDDGDACTTDSCDAATGVHHVAVNTDDGDACTVDTCDATGIHHTAVVIDDNNLCTTDSCDSVTGVHHIAGNIDDGDACTTDTCDPVTGNVTHPAAVTDDAIACTVDACDSVTGVSHTAFDSLCTSGMVCGGTGCVAATGTDQDGRIVITEILPVTNTGNAGELVELVNTTANPVDVHDFIFKNGAGQVATIRSALDPTDVGAAAVTIAPGDHVYGIANPTDELAIPLTATFVYGDPGTTFELADAGDTLSLYASGTGSLEDMLPMTTIHTSPTTAMTALEFAALANVTSQLDPTLETAAQNDNPLAWCVTFYPATGARVRVTDTAGAPNGSCSVAVINEVLIDPSGADDGNAFVEIAGPGGAVIGGAKLEDIEGIGANAGNRNTDGDFTAGETDGEVTIPAGTRIPVDGILLVCDGVGASTTTTSVPNASPADVIVRDMDLENGGGDALQLVSASGTLLDVVGYAAVATTALDRATTLFNGLAMFEGTTAVYPATASSLSRSATSSDTNDNRTDFAADATPTPGVANN